MSQFASLVPIKLASAGEHHVCRRKVVPLAQQRQAANLGQRIGGTIAEVQASPMASLAITQECVTCRGGEHKIMGYHIDICERDESGKFGP
jgi:hypothetical protein